VDLHQRPDRRDVIVLAPVLLQESCPRATSAASTLPAP
jgi:hypothetical protein